jgi:fructose 1,6-bisphosphate aldolase/phosphatase
LQEKRSRDKTYFDDLPFDLARREVVEYAAVLRRMGEFEPARLGSESMEYTALPKVLEKLKDRLKKPNKGKIP